MIGALRVKLMAVLWNLICFLIFKYRTLWGLWIWRDVSQKKLVFYQETYVLDQIHLRWLLYGHQGEGSKTHWSQKLTIPWQPLGKSYTLGAGLGGLVGCAVRLETRRSQVQPRQHSFVEIDHEIFSMVILSHLLIQEGQLSVSGERMCTILVNRLED